MSSAWLWPSTVQQSYVSAAYYPHYSVLTFRAINPLLQNIRLLLVAMKTLLLNWHICNPEALYNGEAFTYKHISMKTALLVSRIAAFVEAREPFIKSFNLTAP